MPACRPGSGVLDWVATICVALAFVLIFEAEVAKPYRIPSSSMEPTLHCARPAAWCEARFSDRVIVNRLAYRFDSPKRGQIVVFNAPAAASVQCGEGGTFVKRLIGLPGDTISEHNGAITVNGKRLNEPYALGTRRTTTWRARGTSRPGTTSSWATTAATPATRGPGGRCRARA